MAVREGSLNPPSGRRKSAMSVARAAGISLALHVAILAILGGLARRPRARPPVELEDHDVVEVSPVEIPVPEDLPAWPTPGTPQDNVALHNESAPARPRAALPGAPPILAPPRPRQPAQADPADPADPRALPAGSEGTVAVPAQNSATTPAVTPTPEPPPVSAPPRPEVPRAQPAAAPARSEPDAQAPPVDADVPPVPAAADAAPAGSAVDAGTPGSPAVTLAPEAPVSGVIGVGAVGGSPLALFVTQLNDQVRGQWRAKEVYARLDPRGRLPRSMFSTILDVRIRGDGTLERVAVLGTSGSPELDAEAVETFKRVPKMPRPPATVLDAAGGYELKFGLHLDVATFHFQAETQRAILKGWRGSPAFNRAGDRARITLARMLLTRDGVLVRALVLGSAGIDFLDEGVLKALPPNLRFPRPPPAYIRHPGLVPIDVEFIHNVHVPSGVRVLRPRETAETK